MSETVAEYKVIRHEHELTEGDRRECFWHEITLPGDPSRSFVRGEPKHQPPPLSVQRIDLSIAPLGKDCRVEVNGQSIRCRRVVVTAEVDELTRVDLECYQPTGEPYEIHGWLMEAPGAVVGGGGVPAASPARRDTDGC